MRPITVLLAAQLTAAALLPFTCTGRRHDFAWTSAPSGWIAADFAEATTMADEWYEATGDYVVLTEVPDGWCVQTMQQLHSNRGACQ